MLEDLADAHWPPPWRDGDVDAVLAALAEVAATPPTGELPALAAEDWSALARRRARPGARCSALGLVSPQWLERALPELAAAARTSSARRRLRRALRRAQRQPLPARRPRRSSSTGTTPGSAIPRSTSPSGCRASRSKAVRLRTRSGVDEFAPVVAGFFAARAGLPPPEGAPEVRGFQRAQLEVALPWACRALGLAAALVHLPAARSRRL